MVLEQACSQCSQSKNTHILSQNINLSTRDNLNDVILLYDVMSDKHLHTSFQYAISISPTLFLKLSIEFDFGGEICIILHVVLWSESHGGKINLKYWLFRYYFLTVICVMWIFSFFIEIALMIGQTSYTVMFVYMNMKLNSCIFRVPIKFSNFKHFVFQKTMNRQYQIFKNVWRYKKLNLNQMTDFLLKRILSRVFNLSLWRGSACIE